MSLPELPCPQRVPTQPDMTSATFVTDHGALLATEHTKTVWALAIQNAKKNVLWPLPAGLALARSPRNFRLRGARSYRTECAISSLLPLLFFQPCSREGSYSFPRPAKASPVSAWSSTQMFQSGLQGCGLKKKQQQHVPNLNTEIETDMLQM